MHSWQVNREEYTLDYLVGGELRDSHELKAFELLDGQDLCFSETITMDDNFYSTECFLSYDRLEEVDSWKWASFDIKTVKYRGYYVYATGGTYSQVLYKKVPFVFLGEEVWESSGRLNLGLPKMQIIKTGETVQEYLAPKDGEYKHILLKMQLAVIRYFDGKMLGQLPIVFDVVRTTESVWNNNNDDIVVIAIALNIAHPTRAPIETKNDETSVSDVFLEI